MGPIFYEGVLGFAENRPNPYRQGSFEYNIWLGGFKFAEVYAK